MKRIKARYKQPQLIIYKAEINGKVYIGQTTNGFSYRVQQHYNQVVNNKTIKGVNKFYYYCGKYGWENIEWEILEILDSINDLDDREEYWINFYNSRSNGLNYGTSKSKAKFNKEILRMNSAGENNPFYGKKHSEETRKNISDKLKLRNKEFPNFQDGEKNPSFKGYIVRESDKKKMLPKEWGTLLKKEVSPNTPEISIINQIRSVARGERKQYKGERYYYEW